MSTKNLAKAVIQGGRNGESKYDRRRSSQDLRVQTKQYLKAVTLDPNIYDEEFEPEIKVVYKAFYDRLGPMYRWIKKQVGRPWDEVRSEIFQKFDTKTVAGRHITFDHLLSEINETASGYDDRGIIINSDTVRNWRHGFFVENGILCAIKNRYPKFVPFDKNYIDIVPSFLQGRIIGEKEGKLHWFCPTEGIWKAEFVQPKIGYMRYGYELKYLHLDNGEYVVSRYNDHFGIDFKTHGDHWKECEQPFSFKQRAELSADQVKTFNDFPERIKKDILAFGKGR